MCVSPYLFIQTFSFFLFPSHLLVHDVQHDVYYHFHCVTHSILLYRKCTALFICTFAYENMLLPIHKNLTGNMICLHGVHCAKKPVTTMLTYPWRCTVLHCNHLGNTWKPLVLMTRHFDYCPSASEC